MRINNNFKNGELVLFNSNGEAIQFIEEKEGQYYCLVIEERKIKIKQYEKDSLTSLTEIMMRQRDKKDKEEQEIKDKIRIEKAKERIERQKLKKLDK